MMMIVTMTMTMVYDESLLQLLAPHLHQGIYTLVFLLDATFIWLFRY